MTEVGGRITGRRLGKRPPKNERALMLGDILTGVVPAHPGYADHFSKIADWDILGNDEYGDCGPVSVANSRAVVTKYLAGAESYPNLNDVFDLYRRSGNPQFDPTTNPPTDDNGVDMQTMLEAVHSGGIAGTKAVAFAKVDHTNIDEVRAAIAIFGFVLFGVTLQAAQQSQTDKHLWDYSPSSLWGGHAVIGGTYSGNTTGSDIGVETWAMLVGMTDAFFTHQVDEVWVVIWPEHFGTAAFQAGVDQKALVAAYAAVTGGKVLPVPPAPAPTPTPTPPPPAPTPGPGAGFLVDPSSVPGLVAKIDHARVRYQGSDPNGHATAAEYTTALLASHLLGIHMTTPA